MKDKKPLELRELKSNTLYLDRLSGRPILIPGPRKDRICPEDLSGNETVEALIGIFYNPITGAHEYTQVYSNMLTDID